MGESDSAAMVVIGAGQAGSRAALTLRDAGHDGPVILLGSEQVAPYERPPLSKDHLAGEREVASFTLASKAALEGAGIDFRPGATATAIDRRARMVTLDNGERLAFAKLLLATGRAPRKLPIPVTGLDGRIHVLRDLDDCTALRAALRPGAHLAILGGGFIGLEVAATARGLGAAVTVIEMQPRLLSRAVPEYLAARLEARHRTAGVTFCLGRSLAAVEPSEAGLALTLDDGQQITADALLVGIGAVARTELAETAGLVVDQGIVVDEYLATSDPDIFAAGDVTAFLDPRLTTRQRLESWENAEVQGALAARNMLGAGEAYSALPWFWSDQYELTLQMAGQLQAAARSIERPLGDDGVVLFHLAEDGRLIGVSALGPAAIAKEFKLAQRLAERGLAPDPEKLADPQTRLKALLRD